jgi:hypothetical protein
MKSLALLLWVSVSLSAATISASDTTADLQPGDTLAFDILTWNFGDNAARFGLPRYPTDVSFSLVSGPVSDEIPFTAWLVSPDCSIEIPFAGPLFFTPGLLSSSRYSGAVSTLHSYVHLSIDESDEIFQSGSAKILVVNSSSGNVMLGLPPNTLRGDLSVSLTGGPLSVGALSGPVTFQSAVPEPANFIPNLLVFGLFGIRGCQRMALWILNLFCNLPRRFSL